MNEIERLSVYFNLSGLSAKNFSQVALLFFTGVFFVDVLIFPF
jgi:hypothetical protein